MGWLEKVGDWMNTKQLKSLLLTGAVMFLLAFAYAWSMGVVPLVMCAKLAVASLIPWAWGKATDADKSLPSMDNLKAAIGIGQK